jgi:tetratricopeptide (TPR) repeat protein
LATDQDGQLLVWLGQPSTASTSAEAEGQAPLSYTPPHLTEKILASRAALEGERKQVTVLFADIKVAANLYLGANCFASGDYRQAVDLGQKILQWLEGNLGRQRFDQAAFPAVYSGWFLTHSLGERGEFDKGIAHGQEGVRIAEALDHPYSLTQACTSLGYLYGVKGDFSHAVSVLERGLVLARDWNLTLLSPNFTGFLGHVYALSERVPEGLSLLKEALEALESIGFALFHSLFVVYLGEACVLADRLDEALALAGQALALVRQRGQRGYEAWALRLLGEIAAYRDPPGVEPAEDHYRQAIALAGELGIRPLLAHCHLGLGVLSLKIGRGEQARPELSTAIALYRAMDMTFWLSRAEAALAGVAGLGSLESGSG